MARSKKSITPPMRKRPPGTKAAPLDQALSSVEARHQVAYLPPEQKTTPISVGRVSALHLPLPNRGQARGTYSGYPTATSTFWQINK